MRLRRLEPVLRQALRGACRLPRGDRVLVAVSGGADSVALLLALRSVTREFELTLHAAHLHHGLRGAAADADLEFVRALCAGAGVPLTAARWNARERMKRRGLAGEAGLRTLRRAFLVATADREACAVIATGHTADDQLETVLMRLSRGAGLPGLSGMRARHGRWIKPLLGATRAAVEADLERADQPWCEDASNLEGHLARNRIRHDAIPALLRALTGKPATAGRAAADRGALALRVARSAREAREAAQFVDARARRMMDRIVVREAGAIALDSTEVASYPRAIQRSMLRGVWKEAEPRSSGLTGRHLEALLTLMRGPRRLARIALPLGWEAVRQGERLVFTPAGDGRKRPAAVASRPKRARRPTADLKDRVRPQR